jgi:acetyltransferase-like isoleucine patch superfamily enzyme
LVIGDHVGITGSSIVCFDHISIGNNVLIGPGCSIIDTDGHSINPDERRTGFSISSPIIIEDDVFIGTKCIILKGVRIGEGSIIAAGSVVMDSVPSFTVVAGNPAQKYRRKKRVEGSQ